MEEEEEEGEGDRREEDGRRTQREEDDDEHNFEDRGAISGDFLDQPMNTCMHGLDI